MSWHSVLAWMHSDKINNGAQINRKKDSCVHLNICNLRTSEINIYSLVIKWVRRNRSKPMTFIQFVDTHTYAYTHKQSQAHSDGKQSHHIQKITNIDIDVDSRICLSICVSTGLHLYIFNIAMNFLKKNIFERIYTCMRTGIYIYICT